MAGLLRPFMLLSSMSPQSRGFKCVEVMKCLMSFLPPSFVLALLPKESASAFLQCPEAVVAGGLGMVDSRERADDSPAAEQSASNAIPEAVSIRAWFDMTPLKTIGSCTVCLGCKAWALLSSFDGICVKVASAKQA
eukprot:523877-Amphidinium_carterae.1